MLLTTLIAVLALFPTDPASLTIPTAEAASSNIQMERLAWLNALSACENPDGDPKTHHLDTNGRYSDGVLQFQMATWLAYHGLFGTTHENIFDPELQKRVAAYMIDHGGLYANWWTCGHQTVNKLGDWPEINEKAAEAASS